MDWVDGKDLVHMGNQYYKRGAFHKSTEKDVKSPPSTDASSNNITASSLNGPDSAVPVNNQFRAPLADETILLIMDELLHVVVPYLHENHKIAHRDLAARNIMLPEKMHNRYFYNALEKMLPQFFKDDQSQTRNFTYIKIIDWGLAKSFSKCNDLEVEALMRKDYEDVAETFRDEFIPLIQSKLLRQEVTEKLEKYAEKLNEYCVA